MARPAPKFPRELDAFIEDQVRSGAYADREAIIIDALDLLRERMVAEAIDDETKLARLNAKLQTAIDSLDRGEGVEITDTKAWLDGLGRRPRRTDAAA